MLSGDAVKRRMLRIVLRAAMRRVGIYRYLDAKAFETELRCQMEIASISSRGVINWRRFELGQRLFDCLGEAQNWRCCYCGSRMSNASSWFGLPKTIESTLEHVIPLSRGGPDHPDNMVVACCQCNQLRGNLPVDEFLRRMADEYCP